MADLSLHVVFFLFWFFGQFCNEKFHKKEFLISQKGAVEGKVVEKKERHFHTIIAIVMILLRRIFRCDLIEKPWWFKFVER